MSSTRPRRPERTGWQTAKAEHTTASGTWLITGVSSGFGRELTEQPLARGDRVVGLATLRARVADFEKQTDLAASTDFRPSE